MRLLFILLMLPILAMAVDKSQSSKNLDFEGEVMEGMSKTPVDSLENVARNDKVKKNHLYKKRTSYVNEMKAVSKEIGNIQ